MAIVSLYDLIANVVNMVQKAVFRLNRCNKSHIYSTYLSEKLALF